MTALTSDYARRRAWIGTYFDRTASAAWASLTSDAPVSRVRANVRAGRDEMRGIVRDSLPARLDGARVLDAGCGTGTLAIELAQRGAHVVAVDLAATLVDIGRERAEAAGVGHRIEFRAGEMNGNDDTFDHVVAMDSVIHYDLPDIASAIRGFVERARVSAVVTVAPWTPVLGTLLKVGRLFPAGDRAPRIVPVSERAVRDAVARAGVLDLAELEATRTVRRGFYRSRAYRFRCKSLPSPVSHPS